MLGTFVIAAFLVVHAVAQPPGINTKLDFGEDAAPKDKVTVSEVSSLPNIGVQEAEIIEEPKIATHRQNNNDDGVEHVCGAGGCNTTVKVKNDSSKDTITTDILVHLKTKVDFSKAAQNGTNNKEDVPDIPVVAGYGGLLPKERNNGYRPDNVVISKPPYNDKSLFDPPFRALAKEAYPSFAPGVSNNIKYKENGIELQVPYLDPSYNNHYFGENPAPQYVFYPKSAAQVRNPVAFANAYNSYGSRRTWDNPGIVGGGNYHVHRSSEQYARAPCTCQQQQQQQRSPIQGQWYPVAGGDAYAKSLEQQRAPRIDDKLAPLE